MTPVESFVATVARIEAIRKLAADAVNIPARARRAADAVHIAPHHGYQGGEYTRAAAMGKAIHERLLAEAEVEGQAKRAQVQAACAAELEAIRRDLCRQAADAAIALGWIARDLERDASR